MKYYFAPMQGVAGHIYRSTFHKHFGTHLNRYYAPFIFADQCKGFKTRDLDDLHPDHNKGMTLIPQLLTNSGPDFVHTAKKLKTLGYSEVNLNLGCPATTVVAKRRGSGLLAFKDDLKLMLDHIFEKADQPVSIKTRLGKTSAEEFYDLMALYNAYPISELIIHPRVQTDLYDNTPNWEVFKEALALSKNPIVYNGDLFSPQEIERFRAAFPQVDRVMLGRGLLRNGGLINSAEDQKPMNMDDLQAFHNDLYENYVKAFGDERRVLFRMKELWFYLIESFDGAETNMARIKTSDTFEAYEGEVQSLFEVGKLSFKRL